MPKVVDLLREGKIEDPFFEEIPDGEWNACVGEQGEEINYVEGYLQAAEILVETLLKESLYGQRDTLAMPILYNARHGLELALKYVLAELVALDMATPREGTADHDIMSYWQHLDLQAVGDEAFRIALGELRPFVASFSKKDIDGQELRYFVNRDDEQSLGDQAVVNIRLISMSVRELREILHRLMRRVEVLEAEAVTPTRTRKCSRTDLVEIARIVGPKPTWTEDAFLERKGVAMARYDLSSRGFSEAIEAIRASRDLKTIIGLETPLVHLTPGKIKAAVELWLDANPPAAASQEPRVIEVSDIDLDEIQDHGRKMAALNAAARELLSVEEFAELQTIFYIGRNGMFGEQYELELEHTLNAHRQEKDRRMILHHILSKTNFVSALSKGLERIGQPSLARQVREARDARRAA